VAEKRGSKGEQGETQGKKGEKGKEGGGKKEKKVDSHTPLLQFSLQGLQHSETCISPTEEFNKPLRTGLMLTMTDPGHTAGPRTNPSEQQPKSGPGLRPYPPFTRSSALGGEGLRGGEPTPPHSPDHGVQHRERVGAVGTDTAAEPAIPRHCAHRSWALPRGSCKN